MGAGVLLLICCEFVIVLLIGCLAVWCDLFAYLLILLLVVVWVLLLYLWFLYWFVLIVLRSYSLC